MTLMVSILLCALATIMTPAPAFAYVDFGSGSMLLQLILGGLAGLLVLLKLWWSRVKAMIGRWRESRRSRG